MSVRELTKEKFVAEVVQAGKKTVVEFWAPWCVYCKRLNPVIDRLAAKLGDALPVGKINVDEQPELEEQYGINTLPTLLLFEGETHGEPLVAPASQAQIEEWLRGQSAL